MHLLSPAQQLGTSYTSIGWAEAYHWIGDHCVTSVEIQLLLTIDSFFFKKLLNKSVTFILIFQSALPSESFNQDVLWIETHFSYTRL